jgi:NADP-dependent 3-hydroxy acid dehydrogenase YdfG
MHTQGERRFKGKAALLTGASGGVGRSIALRLAQEGAHVALVGRRLDALRALSNECADLGSKAHCYQADFEDDAQVENLAKRVQTDFSGLDILVHNAGTIALSEIVNASLDDFDLQYQCNVRAPFALTKLLLPGLIRRRGQVVFINSSAGLEASAGVAQYAATKHAVKAIADSLRKEVNPFGIRVLNVFLGRTATPMQAMVHEHEGKTYRPSELIQPDQVAAIVSDALALGPEAEITEIRVRPMLKPSQSPANS